MNVKLLCVFALILFAAAAGCGSLGTAVVAPTEAPLWSQEEYIAEATRIAAAGAAQATAVAETAAAAVVYVERMEAINAQLAVTLRAAVPATRQAVNMVGEVTPGMNATFNPALGATPLPGQNSLLSSGTQFIETGTAARVRDSDGCADPVITTFTTSTPRIYATARALNIRAGVRMGANWSRDGQLVYASESWTVGRDAADFCLWFYIEPSDIAFTPGAWSVQLFADSQPVGTPAVFTITG